MNFTKEQRDRFYKAQNDFSRSTQNIVDKLVEDCDSLERLLEASRESRMLSAVPSAKQIAKELLEILPSFADEQLNGDKQFAWYWEAKISEFLIKRGIAA